MRCTMSMIFSTRRILLATDDRTNKGGKSFHRGTLNRLTYVIGPKLSENRGCPRSKASGGEAVVCYREPSATKEMGCHRLSRRVNKNEIKKQNSYLTDAIDIKT